ncbi:MAG: hypothetical protein J5J06_03015 [Phycisphaerae bacterium]|nr:hypothetical protein [Phycisphaerae bacterium]
MKQKRSTNAKPVQSGKWKWISVAGVVLAGSVAAVFAIFPVNRAPASSLPPDLQPDALRARMEQGGPGTMREIMRRDDLTDEQRRELRDNMRQSWQAAMKERVDEYFDAPDDLKPSVLDKHLDEFMKRVEEWRREAPQQPPSEAERDRWRAQFANRTQQERKEQSESRNPDEMARGMAYFSAMRARAQERGIQMPGGPGFGRGGGGGPGGRGGPGGPGGNARGGSSRPGSSGGSGGGRP